VCVFVCVCNRVVAPVVTLSDFYLLLRIVVDSSALSLPSIHLQKKRLLLS